MNLDVNNVLVYKWLAYCQYIVIILSVNKTAITKAADKINFLFLFYFTVQRNRTN